MNCKQSGCKSTRVSVHKKMAWELLAFNETSRLNDFAFFPTGYRGRRQYVNVNPHCWFIKELDTSQDFHSGRTRSSKLVSFRRLESVKFSFKNNQRFY